VVYCGSRTVKWEDSCKTIASLYYKDTYYTIVSADRDQAFQEERNALINIGETGPRILRYTNLRFQLGNTEYRDTRDKIFAALVPLTF
jgi:hypothetical protein